MRYQTVGLNGCKIITVKTFGHEKTHYIAMLSCCPNGTKLPLLLIFKRRTLPKDNIPCGICCWCPPKRGGWMKREWRHGWISSGQHIPVASLKTIPTCVRPILHPHNIGYSRKGAEMRLEMKMAVIPCGLISQLQPLDVSINKPFKAFMNEEWKQWMRTTDHDLTPIGHLKRSTIAQAHKWVINSWNAVKTETVVKLFKKMWHQ